MDLEKILKFRKGISIEDNATYYELNFELKKLEGIADNILSYLSSPKEKNKSEMILVSNEQINSNYLDKLAEVIQGLDETLWNYRQENSIPNFSSKEIYNSPILDKPEKLFMYSEYLKSRGNPLILDINELRRIKRHPFKEKGFQLEISDDKYKKINEKLDNLQYNMIPKIIFFPFEVVWNSLRFVGRKVDNFFEKYKYQEDGKIPKDYF